MIKERLRMNNIIHTIPYISRKECTYANRILSMNVRKDYKIIMTGNEMEGVCGIVFNRHDRKNR